MSLDRALALVDAAGPVGYPNPTVGAVVVSGGEIVGEGVTERTADRTAKSWRSLPQATARAARRST